MRNLERTIFSLIMGRLEGDKISEKSYIKYIENLVRDGIGGFVLFGGQYEEIKNFLSYLQSIASKPLIIASDIETGVGQQIKGGTLIPSQMGIRAGFDLIKNKSELKTLYSILAKEALDVGINLALIPVLDINTEPENPIVCTRAFSDDPDIVSKYGRFIIKSLKSYGLATCGKHFPGHGSTKIDSHIQLPIVAENIKMHLKPFKEAIKEGVSAIMVGHLLVPEIDTTPSTLSEKAINGLLRQELGFKGAVFTDAMNMKALKNYAFSHALALKAGADIILHPEEPYNAMEEIKLAYKKGLIDEKRIEKIVKRVDKFRKKLKSLSYKQYGTDQFLANNSFFIHYVFKKTATVIKNEMSTLKSSKIVPYLTGTYTSNIKQIFESYFGSAFDLKDYKPVDAIHLIAAFTNIKAAGKEYKLNAQQKTMIENIISNNKTVFVSFGNPYVIGLPFFKKAKTIILIYDSHEIAVRAFLDLLNDGLKDCSEPPVKIKWSDEE